MPGLIQGEETDKLSLQRFELILMGRPDCCHDGHLPLYSCSFPCPPIHSSEQIPATIRPHMELHYYGNHYISQRVDALVAHPAAEDAAGLT